MKQVFLFMLAIAALASCKKERIDPGKQSSIPEFYLDNNEVTPLVHKELGIIEGIESPRDLDFKQDKNELWVMNKGYNGSDFVIIQRPGEETENIIKRKDSHSDHFVPDGSAMAFSDINTFATTPEIKNTVQDTSATFMGPALWSGDLSIFANIYQSNWNPDLPLGSHYDMLHQSPYSMGIAHDQGNSFFVLDGWNGNMCHYEFVDDHGPGAEYHGDGRVFRYTDVSFIRVRDIPSHIIKDQTTGLLYFCDTYGGKVIKVDISTAKATSKIQATNELLNRYYGMTGATVSTFAEGLEKPSGIEINDNRLFVADYATGIIHVYNIETGVKLGSLDTGNPGIVGIVCSSSNRLWFVNYLTNELYQIIPQ